MAMATELEPAAGPAGAPLDADDDDEEHWLYGDDSGKQEDGPIPGHSESHTLQDVAQESRIVNCEDRELLQQALPSGEDDEEDSESDSDDDDIRVTIGNIKTGAPSYMGTPMNLNLKTGRGYGASASAKLQPKGIDLEAAGNINGLPVIEVDLESFEDKPWRKPGADLSDYFNYGFNEETWKAYCEKQRRLQLGLEPSAPVNTENKITVQQGRIGNAEKEPENNIVKMDFKTDFVALVGGRMKAGPPPNRKLGGTIDVIGGQAGTIRRVEGRRRDKHASEENPIQVLGDHGSKSQPPQQPQQPSQPQQPPQQQPFAPPTGPPPPIGGPPPPPHFLHPPPPPVTSVPPPLHPPGLPPPGPIPGSITENMPVCEKPMADTIEADGVATEGEIYEAAQPNDTAAVPDPEEEPVYMEMARLQARQGRPHGRLQTPCIGPLLKKEGISWPTLATIVYAACGNLNPNCCSYCYHIVYHKEYRDAESDDDDDDDDKAASGHGLEHETSAEEGVRPLTPPPTPTPPEVQGEPLRGDAAEYLCVEELFPDIWNEPVDLALLARQVPGELDPECCYRCGMVHMFKNTSPV